MFMLGVVFQSFCLCVVRPAVPSIVCMCTLEPVHFAIICVDVVKNGFQRKELAQALCPV